MKSEPQDMALVFHVFTPKLWTLCVIALWLNELTKAILDSW